MVEAILGDHPRLCGEKVVSSVMLYPSIGSPPPMRGKGLGNPFSHRQVGITPAYAGKSSSFFAISSACWDHPRLCGEKPQTAVLFLRRSGSPPPMRGKAVSSLVSSTLSRITPAYAGKSCFARCHNYRRRDHPRLCGEKRATSGRSSRSTGSPPPMRGKGREHLQA